MTRGLVQVVTQRSKGWIIVEDNDDGYQHAYKLPRDQAGIRLYKPAAAARASDGLSVRKGVKRAADGAFLFSRVPWPLSRPHILLCWPCVR